MRMTKFNNLVILGFIVLFLVFLIDGLVTHFVFEPYGRPSRNILLPR